MNYKPGFKVRVVSTERLKHHGSFAACNGYYLHVAAETPVEAAAIALQRFNEQSSNNWIGAVDWEFGVNPYPYCE